MPREQQPIDLDVTGGAVVEFGPPPAPARRWGSAGFLRELADDRRVVPLAAALGAVAVFASMVSEWQITTVDRGLFGGEVGEMQVPTGAADLGALGTGYLVGIFLVVGAVVLTMFGPPGGRRYARLTGLSAGGTVVALLLALTVTLRTQSRIVTQLFNIDLQDDQLKITYGRGLWCALVGVLFALLALYLAGRHLPGGPLPASAETEAVAAVPQAAEDSASVWSWRWPAEARRERPADEPLELTVSPTKPFTPGTDDRGQPNGSGRPGISG